MKFFSLQSIKIIALLLFFIKILFFIFIKESEELFSAVFASGNDSGYYHAYAIGRTDTVLNVWPVVLRFLNGFGLYDRYFFSFFLLTISIALCFIFASLIDKPKLVNKKIYHKYQLIYWHFISLIAFYPSVFFITLDVYRDIAMVLVFSMALIFIKKYLEENINKFSLFLVPILVFVYFSFLFREYLGMALLLSLFTYNLKFTGKKIVYYGVLYFSGLAILNSLGYLNPLLEYRGEDGFTTGGSTLGVSLLGKNVIEFVFLFIYSGAMQLLGLFLVSVPTLFAFISESIIFIIASYYIFKNKFFLTPFAKYLLVFSIIYASVWIIGNDNVGTAVRLRVFNYICIYLVAATIFIRKYESNLINKKYILKSRLLCQN